MTLRADLVSGWAMGLMGSGMIRVGKRGELEE
jgi:hypothetical protein